MGTKAEAGGKLERKKRGKKAKKRNKVERRASYVSTPVRSQRNAALKSLRRSHRSQRVQKKRRGILSRLFSRNKDAGPSMTLQHDTDDTNTTVAETPDVATEPEQFEVLQDGDGPQHQGQQYQVQQHQEQQHQGQQHQGQHQGQQQQQPYQTMEMEQDHEKHSSSSSNSSRRTPPRKPKTRISFSSARTRRPRDVHNWLQWRSELNQHLSSLILSGSKIDMDEVAVRAVSESVDKDALKAILKVAYGKDHTTLDQVAYLVFGVPRIHDKENVQLQPPSTPRFGLDSKSRRPMLDAVYATPQPILPVSNNQTELPLMSNIDHADHGQANSGLHNHLSNHSTNDSNNQSDTGQHPSNMPIYATPMKPVAGMYRNYYNRPYNADPGYGIPRKTNRSNAPKYAISPACKASPKRSQTGGQVSQENGNASNGNVRRNKKHLKDPNRCPTIDENFTMEYYHEANKVALESLIQKDSQNNQGANKLEENQINDDHDFLEDPEIDYETEEEEDVDGEDQVAPPMLAEPMDAPRRRSRRGNRSRAGTPKGWAPSMAEILRAKSVLSPIASPGHSPPPSPTRQRQIMSKFAPPVNTRCRLLTPQGSAPVSRQTSNASSSITLPGQRSHPLGYHPSQNPRGRCDSNLSSLADSVAHAGAGRRLSDISSIMYSPTPPLPPHQGYAMYNDPGGAMYGYGKRHGPPVAPKPRGPVITRPPVPCPPPPPPVQSFEPYNQGIFHHPYHPGGPGLPSDLMRAIQLNRKPSNLSSVGPYA